MIDAVCYPQLYYLLWYRTFEISREDAFLTYKRYWRHVTLRNMENDERRLLLSLIDEFAGGVFEPILDVFGKVTKQIIIDLRPTDEELAAAQGVHNWWIDELNGNFMIHALRDDAENVFDAYVPIINFRFIDPKIGYLRISNRLVRLSTDDWMQDMDIDALNVAIKDVKTTF